MKTRFLSARFLAMLPAVLGMLCQVNASADSSVWRVSKGESYLYLGGTVHILTPEDFPLPAEFETAYAQSARLVFETDMQQLESMETQRGLLSQMTYQPGESLENKLTGETLRQLEDFLADRGVPLAKVLPLRAGWLSITLTLMELDRLGLVGEGVDQHFQKRGIADLKSVGELEAVSEQLAYLTQMGEGSENEMILETLLELQSIDEMMHDMKSAWRLGDLKRLGEVGLKDLLRYPAVYQSLLVNRNNRWLPKIEALLENAEVEFVLVGALHLVGDDGLLALLSEHGFVVEQI